MQIQSWRGAFERAIRLTVSVFVVVLGLGGCPVSDTLKVTVPDVVGLDVDVARATISGTGLSFGIVAEEYNASVAPGLVICQSPVAGTQARYRTAVDVLVSLGLEPIVVPDVSGLSPAAAEIAIRNAGFTVGTVTQVHSDTVAEGNVTSQEPAGGTRAVPSDRPDDRIKLWVSLGPSHVSVPFVIGQTEEEAEESLESVDLVAGDPTYAYSDTIAEGLIVSQDPSAGPPLVERGSTVALIVSLGVEPLPVPTVTGLGLSESEAVAALEAGGMTAGQISEVYDALIPVGDVVSQDPEGGTLQAPGTAVRFAISKGPEKVQVPEVTGATETDARDLLMAENLAIGTVTEVTSDLVPPGNVISQEPVADTLVLPGSVVDLIVSLGRAIDLTVDSSEVVLTDGKPSVLVTVFNDGDGDLSWTASVATSEVTVTPSSFQGNSAEVTISASDFSEAYESLITFTNDADPLDAFDLTATVVSIVAPGEMIAVEAGDFTMSNVGEVTLSAYEIGKFEVTNAEFAAVFNWALTEGLFGDYSGGNVYGPNAMLLLEVGESTASQIEFVDGAFRAISRDGFSMADHPAVMMTWHGAVMYCNWLSEMEGLEPIYDTETWEPLAPLLLGNGYRLPTEAEWERAAAWDGDKHWVYGFTDDEIDVTRCNYALAADTGKQGDTPIPLNPLGLSEPPFTTPVGYYDGGNPETRNGASPIGAYDMSGNVKEWCHDGDSGLPEGPVADPTGGGIEQRYVVLRGGAWDVEELFSQTSKRDSLRREIATSDIGFRVVRNP